MSVEDGNITTDDLISAMKKRPILWDTTLHDYKNPEVKRQKWNEVYRLFYKDFDKKSQAEQGFIVHDVKRKWKSLRDCYTRDVTKRALSATLASRKPYVYSKKLSFLKPFLRRVAKDSSDVDNITNDDESLTNDDDMGETSSRPSIATVSIKKDIEESEYFEDETKIFDPFCEINENQETSVESWNEIDIKEDFLVEKEGGSQSTNKPTSTTTVQDPLTISLDTATYYPSQKLNTADADKHFLLSLLPHLNCLTFTEKLQFQIKTLNILNEIMNQRESENKGT